MRVENIQATQGQASIKGFTNLFTFTLVLNDGIKLHGVKLIKTPEGTYLVYPPDTISGGKAWWMPTDLRAAVLELALEARDQATLARFAKLANL